MLAALKSLFSRLVNWLLILLAVSFGIVFTIANKDIVRVSLDPFSGQDSILSVAAPLSLVILLSAFIGLVLGGIGGWFSAGRVRQLARMRKRENKKLLKEVKAAESTSVPSRAVVAQKNQSNPL